LAPKRGGRATMAVNMPGRRTSEAYRVIPWNAFDGGYLLTLYRWRKMPLGRSKKR
jgi:hypothetical protein